MRSPVIDTRLEDLEPYSESLLRPFVDQSAPIYRDDLVVLHADTLLEMEPLRFRAVAAILPPGDENGWRLRRRLFDRGLVCIGAAEVAGSKALCFLASDQVRSFDHLHVESRGHVSMVELVERAGFANQMWRYACAKLYALRHGLTPVFPGWEGAHLFGLEDKSCEGLEFPRVTYAGFATNDREMWYMEEPPFDIDLAGYFQEIPECWRRHRPLLRRMFQLRPEQIRSLNAWRDAMTEESRRTLVAIHVRRGDYRGNVLPQLRPVPEEWYLNWLRTIWPTLNEPVLFVGTDEPDSILPIFQEFEPISAASAAPGLPDHVRDFEILRRADHLAICNSSFSRMAAILAPSNQKCVLASFEKQLFEPYDPWMDPAFWQRFERPSPVQASQHKPRSKRSELPAAMASNRNGLEAREETGTILFDVSDLLLYMLYHHTLSGIQRVQCEILRNLSDLTSPQQVRFVVVTKEGQLGTIDRTGLMEIVEKFRLETPGRDPKTSRRDIEAEVRALLNHGVSRSVQSGDIFLTLGAFWGVKGMGLLLQKLKNSGVIIGVLIHDIIPITAPEYFEALDTRRFVKGVVEALSFTDFILTTTEYNRASLTAYLASQKMDSIPVHLTPLGHALTNPASKDAKISDTVARILLTEYVLCVGTIEVRKNPSYLFNIWKTMVNAGRPNIPTLVLVGRRGWLVQDFLCQLTACKYLGGKIVLIHDVTDVELDLLYRKCMLTVFPSFVEGWGLPVGESLAHGKICIASAAAGIPEVGGELVDYVDPNNASDGYEKLVRYLDNPELRRRREREIADHFEPRSWRSVADDFLRSTQTLARQIRPLEHVAAIKLPRDRFLEVRSDAIETLKDGLDGTLSAELACVAGWHNPEVSGVRAAKPEAVIRFRADAPVGTRINLVLRLAACGRDFRILIRAGSGSEIEALVLNGTDKLAYLTCEVEPGNLITAHLSIPGVTLEGAGVVLDGDEISDASFWMLKGILYFDPKRVAIGSFQVTLRKPVEVPARVETLPSRGRILIRPAGMDENRRAASFGAFLKTTDTYWPSSFQSEGGVPIFADRADRRLFYSGCGDAARVPRVGRIIDSIKLIRRSEQFVSMSRFSEGSVFDRSGGWKAFGYLTGSQPEKAPWVFTDPEGVHVDEEALAAAPYHEHSYLIFYNGNLHNYYHWVAEGLLCLDVLTRAAGTDSSVKIAVPKTMDIAACLDHRESLRAAGFDRHEIVEVGANLIRVKEAIWVESDLVQSMPGPYLKDFQQRIAALYAGLKTPRTRRLLVARKGPTRTIQNLEQVQKFLSRYDFETVYLEGMSTADQILLFQSAEFIVASHGAGLANLLFCEPGTKVIELMPSVEFRPFFWQIAEKLDLVYGLQFCETVPDNDFHGAVHVDLEKLQALAKMVGAHL